MDYIVEAVALGIDAIAFGAAYSMFQYKKSAIKSIEKAQHLEIDGSRLLDRVASQPGRKLDYVVVRGKVKALSSPLRSQNVVNTFGVVQKFTTREHLVTRHNFGFWSERERTIQVVCNSIPFALQSGNVDIEVADALSANYLCLETISDVYEPTSGSFADLIWGFFTGVRPQGLQKTEEMLREGALLTGIGELVVSEDKASLRLQPSPDGLPFFLTSMPLNTISKRIEDDRNMYRDFCIVLSVIGLGLVGIMAHRYYKQWREKKKEEERLRKKEQTRKARRQRARPGEELPDNQLCIVCRENPKEVVLLPCGHVCICEDCSEDISDLCPVCRAEIQSKNPAYIS